MAAIKGQRTYNVEGLGGRPRKWTVEAVEKEIDEFLEWIKDPNNVFLQDFAVSRGYSHIRLHEWKKSSERMAEACEFLASKQQIALIKGGLSRKLYYPMCAMLLSNYHNMHQKTEQKIVADVTGHAILNDIIGQTKDLVDGCSSEGS